MPPLWVLSFQLFITILPKSFVNEPPAQNFQVGASTDCRAHFCIALRKERVMLFVFVLPTQYGPWSGHIVNNIGPSGHGVIDNQTDITFASQVSSYKQRKYGGCPF